MQPNSGEDQPLAIAMKYVDGPTDVQGACKGRNQARIMDVTGNL